MSTHINLSTAISELKEMFPSFDEDVIHMVLTECRMTWVFRSLDRGKHGACNLITIDYVW